VLTFIAWSGQKPVTLGVVTELARRVFYWGELLVPP
jgi:hypothetical protein